MMDDRVEFVCALRSHRRREVNDALTMHREKWAYCPAGKREPHDWRPTGGMSLDEVKRFARERSMRRLEV